MTRIEKRNVQGGGATRTEKTTTIVPVLSRSALHLPTMESTCDEKETPLHDAIRSNSLSRTKLIANCYPHFLQIPNAGELPLHLACGFDAPRALVESGARAYPQAVDVKDNDGYTPLDLANIQDREEWMEDKLHGYVSVDGRRASLLLTNGGWESL